MFLLWTLFLRAVEIPISVEEPVTTGVAELTPENPVDFDFSQPSGWIRVDSDYLLPNLSIAIGIKEKAEDEWKWSHLKRNDGVITTGSAPMAKVRVFYATKTDLRYAAGYLNKQYNNKVCNRLFVTTTFDNYQAPPKSVTCFVTGSMKNRISLTKAASDPQKQSNVVVEVYKQGKDKKESSVSYEEKEGWYKVVVLRNDKDEAEASNIKFGSNETEAKAWGEISIKPTAGLSHSGTSQTPVAEGGCEEHDLCGEDIEKARKEREAGGDHGDEAPGNGNKDKTKVIIIAVVVTLVVVAIIIIVVVVVVRRDHRVCNASESISTSEDGEKNSKPQTQEDRPRHVSSNSRRSSNARKSDYSHLDV